MKKTAIATLTSEINPAGGNRIQLFPAGEFRGNDGRPVECASWVINAQLAQRLIDAINNKTNPVVIDYEHQTLLSQKNGMPAPAAGWFKQLEWVEGVGLFATDVKWSKNAAAMIADDEYRFISPFFEYDPVSGNVLTLINAGLTNQPALEGMEAVMAAAASYYFSSAKEESSMNEELLERCRWLLNLPIASTASDIIAELDKLKTQITAGDSQAAASFNLSTYLTDSKTKIAALTEQVNTRKVDMSQFVPIDVFHEQQQQIAQLTAQHKAGELEQLITAACSDGRVRGEKMEAFVRQTAKDNPEAARKLIDNLPAIAALTSTQTRGQPPQPDNSQQLDSQTLAMCKAMGVTAEDYIKNRDAMEKGE